MPLHHKLLATIMIYRTVKNAFRCGGGAEIARPHIARPDNVAPD